MPDPLTASATARRPLTVRDRPWAKATAAALTHWGVAPNAISAASMGCAALAGAALALWPHAPGWDYGAWLGPALLVSAAVGIQLRLLCNLFDGMVAIEGGRRSPTGDLWNEVPDRVSDSLILVGAGYGLAAMPGGVDLGWGAALCAALTAYVRVLGASLGIDGLFLGPLAKQQRMAVLTGCCLATAASTGHWDERWVLWTGLLVITVGAALTAVRRLRAIATALRARP